MQPFISAIICTIISTYIALFKQQKKIVLSEATTNSNKVIFHHGLKLLEMTSLPSALPNFLLLNQLVRHNTDYCTRFSIFTG